MTKIYIVTGIKREKYYLYINELGMGELEKKLAERFIERYPHIKPEQSNDAIQWTFINP